MSANVARWVAHTGDALQIEVELMGIDSILPGATVEAFVLDSDGSETGIAGASVISEVDKVVAVPLVTWLTTAVEGTYELKIRLNDVTWPENGRAEIRVEPRNRD